MDKKSSIPEFYTFYPDPSMSNSFVAFWCSLYAANSLAIIILNILLIYLAVVCIRGIKNYSQNRYNTLPPRCQQDSSKTQKAKNMNQYLIFLCVSQLLVGLVGIPLYVVFNFPQIFFPPIAIQTGVGQITNVTQGQLTHNASTIMQNASDVVKQQFRPRSIHFATFCRAQTAFTFIGAFGGFGSGYAILTVAVNRYRAIIATLPCPKRVAWQNPGTGASKIIWLSFRSFIYIKSSCKVMAKKIHRMFWLTLLVLITAVPVAYITGKEHCMLNKPVVGQLSWNKIFLLYSTIIGLIIPVAISAVLYMISIKHLRFASQISETVLSCKSSVEAHGKAIRMIMSVMALHLLVALPLTLVNFCQLFGVLDPSSQFYKRSFANEIINTIISLDAWLNVIIIIYYGSKFKAIFRQKFSCFFAARNLEAKTDEKSPKSPSQYLGFFERFTPQRCVTNENFESYITDSF